MLQSLALAYARQQQPNKAISIAEKIPRISPEYSSAIDTLAQVAAILAKSGQSTQANMVFAKALSLSSTVKELDTRAQAYAAIARAYTNAGDKNAAETARQTAVKWALSLPTNPNVSVTANYMLSLISQQFLDANQVEAAWKTLQEIAKNEYKNTNIGNLVSGALALGNLPVAQQAVDLQYTYGAKESFLDQASQLARAYLDRGRQFEAIKMLSQAANVINNQEKPDPGSVIPIVQLYAKAGRIDDAQKLMAKLPNPTRQQLQQYVDCHK